MKVPIHPNPAEADVFREELAIQTFLNHTSQSGRDQYAPSGWRPIETGPKDGTDVLVYVPRRLGAIYAAASYVGPDNQWWARNMGDVQPTHWMPLPEAPNDG